MSQAEPRAASGGDPHGFAELVAVMDRLRRECAWKREQTPRTLAKHLLEETYETLNAIEAGTRSELAEELGDLLLQVVFQARVAQEDPAEPFGIDEVVAGITAKLYRRNPHVFGDPDPTLDRDDPAAIDAAWQAVKAEEKQRASVLDGVPSGLPALARAAAVVVRAGRVGVVPEHRTDDDAPVGERLLALAAQAAEAGADPEQELRDAVRRLEDAIRAAERERRAHGRPDRMGS